LDGFKECFSWRPDIAFGETEQAAHAILIT